MINGTVLMQKGGKMLDIKEYLKQTKTVLLTQDAFDELMQRASAQPEKRTEERTETRACDLISRQAAIDAHYEYCNKHPDAGFPVWSLKILKDLPSAQPEITVDGYADGFVDGYKLGKKYAQPERKTGKWIVVDDGCISGKCSVCGWEAHMYEDDVAGMDYCPNCGARLEDEG